MSKQSLLILFSSLLILGIMIKLFSNMFSSSNDESLTKVIQEGAFLVDVRTLMEFSEGHVKGSVNIPLNTVESQLSKFKNKDHIVVYCRSGARSSQAKSILEKNGFDNVINGRTWTAVDSIVNKK